MNEDTCLAILAGGMGRRIKGYKPLIMLKNKKLIEYVLENLIPYFNEILVVVRNNWQRDMLMQNIKELINTHRINVVTDMVNLEGPLAGIITAVNYCNKEVIAFAPADTPFIKIHIYEHLNHYIKNCGYEAAVPIWPNRYIEPLVSISVRKSLINVINECIEKDIKSVGAIFNKMLTAYVDVRLISRNPSIEFLNINNYEDLDLAQKFLTNIVKPFSGFNKISPTGFISSNGDLIIGFTRSKIMYLF